MAIDLDDLSTPLMTLADTSVLRRAKPKPRGERKRAKGRKTRAEKKVKDVVRAKCVERDGDCALDIAFWGARGERLNDDTSNIDGWTERCDGDSAWAHMHAKRRSKTMGMPPEERHDTAHSLMLCTKHHEQYDNKRKPRLFITALTRKGADGPLKFRLAR